MYDIHILSGGCLTVSLTVCGLLDWTQDVVYLFVFICVYLKSTNANTQKHEDNQIKH